MHAFRKPICCWWNISPIFSWLYRNILQLTVDVELCKFMLSQYNSGLQNVQIYIFHWLMEWEGGRFAYILHIIIREWLFHKIKETVSYSLIFLSVHLSMCICVISVNFKCFVQFLWAYKWEILTKTWHHKAYHTWKFTQE